MEKYLLTVGPYQISWRTTQLDEHFSSSNFMRTNIHDTLSYFFNYVSELSSKTKDELNIFFTLYEQLLSSKFVMNGQICLPDKITLEGPNQYSTTFLNPYTISLEDYTWLQNHLESLSIQTKKVRDLIYGDLNLEVKSKGYPHFEKERALHQHSYEFVTFSTVSVLDIKKRNEVEDFKSIKLSLDDVKKLGSLKDKYNLGAYSHIYGHALGLVSSSDLAICMLPAYNPFSVYVSCDHKGQQYLSSIGFPGTNHSFEFKVLAPNFLEEKNFNNRTLNSSPKSHWVIARQFEPSLLGFMYINLNPDGRPHLVDSPEKASLYDSLEEAQEALMKQQGNYSGIKGDMFIAQYSLNFTAIHAPSSGPNSLYSLEKSKTEKNSLEEAVAISNPPKSSSKIKV